MSEQDAQRAFQLTAHIARELTECPDLLDAALKGITSGMSGAIALANARASLKDQATLAIMALTNGRVGKELRETLLARVVASIHPMNACGYERGYLDQHNEARATTIVEGAE